MKYFMFAAGLSAFLLSACGGQAAPTFDPAQVQASAIAQASTLMAQTEATFPTDTPTPAPSPLPLISPTLSVTAVLPTDQSTTNQSTNSLTSPEPLTTPTPNSQSNVNTCLQPLDMSGAGKKHDTLIKNETSGILNLSLNLYKPNQFGQCGAISYASVTKNDSINAALPAGFWFAYAWGSHNGTNFKTTGSFFVQPAQFDKIELCIRDGNIVYKPQC